MNDKLPSCSLQHVAEEETRQTESEREIERGE